MLKLPAPFPRTQEMILSNFRWLAHNLNARSGTGTLAQRPNPTRDLEGWQYYATDGGTLKEGKLYMIVNGAWEET